MDNQNLIQLIRESIQNYISEIDHAGEEAAVNAKINAIGEAIALREKKMNMDGLDEAYHDMLDKNKIKELASEVKALKKSLAKYEKQLEKLKSKTDKSSKVEKEEEKEIVDEAFLNENRTAEELFQMFKDEDLLNDRREYDVEDLMSTYPDLSKEEAQKLENMLQNQINETNTSDIYEMLYMQKLAGILSETEYKAKVEEAKKKPSAGMTKKEKSAVAKKAHAGEDIGKKGKGFEKIAKAAEKKYGSEEAGKKVAAAAMWKSQAKSKK